MPLYLINNDAPIIEPSDAIDGTHRTGSLSPDLTPNDISKALGFRPNIPGTDDGKAILQWCFTADGTKCAIWDYKETRWSVFGPSFVFDALFPGKWKA